MERIKEYATTAMNQARITFLRLAHIGTPRFRASLLALICITAIVQGYSLTTRERAMLLPIRDQVEADSSKTSTLPIQELKSISQKLTSMRIVSRVDTFQWMLLPVSTIALCCIVACAIATVLYKRLNKIHHNLMAITHDLKGPLSSTVGHLESLVIRSKDKFEPEVLQQLLIALRGAESAGALVRDIHYVSKLESSGNVSLREKFNVTDLLLDTTISLRQRFNDKKVSLIEDIPPNAYLAFGDISLIERLLRNVLENALRYTGPKGQVTVSLQSIPDQVQITISDTGCGIAADEVSKIFDDSYRGSNTRYTFEGSGVGLTVAKQIAELHGTKIEVKSELGRGTSVSWNLPAATTVRVTKTVHTSGKLVRE